MNQEKRNNMAQDRYKRTLAGEVEASFSKAVLASVKKNSENENEEEREVKENLCEPACCRC